MAVLQERARIGRELHDTVAQTLYAISLGASRARALLQQNEPTEAQRLIDDLMRLANDGQSELRALLTDMRSDLTQGGLTAVLAPIAAEMRTRHGLDIRLKLPDDQAMPHETRDALAMIVREALHNVVKHASASRADVVVEVHDRQLVLLIADDGRGFNPRTQRPAHFGLQTMRERAAALCGTLAIVSDPGLGTQIRVCAPL